MLALALGWVRFGWEKCLHGATPPAPHARARAHTGTRARAHAGTTRLWTLKKSRKVADSAKANMQIPMNVEHPPFIIDTPTLSRDLTMASFVVLASSSSSVATACDKCTT